LKPELIAPVVFWLCHEECKENGSIIEAALGWAGKCKYQLLKIFNPIIVNIYKQIKFFTNNCFSYYLKEIIERTYLSYILMNLFISFIRINI